MKNYVLGFFFGYNDGDGSTYVVLVRKSKPEWQRGKLNGIGGLVEDSDPNGTSAMIREFKEETGVQTRAEDWLHYAELKLENGDNVIVFKGFAPGYVEVSGTPEEPVRWVDVKDIVMGDSEMISNLRWLIPMALDQNRIEAEISYLKGSGYK